MRETRRTFGFESVASSPAKDCSIPHIGQESESSLSGEEGLRPVAGLLKFSPNGYGDDCSKGSGNADGGDVGRRHQRRRDTRGECATESDTGDPCTASPETDAAVRTTEEAPAMRAGRHDRILVSRVRNSLTFSGRGIPPLASPANRADPDGRRPMTSEETLGCDDTAERAAEVTYTPSTVGRSSVSA